MGIDTYSPTRSPTELAAKYSVPEDFLNPNRYLTDVLYLPQELHDLLRDELVVNKDRLLNHEQIQHAIEESVKSNDFTFFGVDHASAVSHELIARSIVDMKDPSFQLAVEYPVVLQTYIDSFMDTGAFQSGEDSNKYSQVYAVMQRQGITDLPENLKGTVFDTNPELIQIYPILLAARATNRSVFCFDSNQDVDRSNDTEEEMEHNLTSGQGDTKTHVVVIAGGDHCAFKNYDNESGVSITSAAQRMEQKGVKVGNFSWDNTTSAQKYASPEQVVESVLHAKVKDKQDSGRTQGLRLDSTTFPGKPNLAADIGFDYFVAA